MNLQYYLLKVVLVFRGGTALYKLHTTPAPRYSEDIDLVQASPEPIGPVMTEIRKKLDPWLGQPKRKQGQGRVTITYRFHSESVPTTPLKLKLEINTREHFSVKGITSRTFQFNSSWYSGGIVDIPTYELEEIMGTKLRALYQRKKGRDLFDLWYVFKHLSLDKKTVIDIFRHYIDKQGINTTFNK